MEPFACSNVRPADLAASVEIKCDHKIQIKLDESVNLTDGNAEINSQQ